MSERLQNRTAERSASVPLRGAIRPALEQIRGRVPVRARTVIARVVPAVRSQFHSVAVAEAVLGVGIVSVAGMVLPGQWGFVRWAPHPLWIVVLAIAIRYAVPAGYIAGAFAAVCQVLLLWLRPGARFTAIPEHDLIQPFLFIVVGMLVSAAVEGQRQRLAEADRRAEEADANVRTVTGAYQAVRTSKLELERQIVGQSTSITTLYRFAKQLETLRTDDLFPAILGLVEQFLEAQACAIYLVEDDLLRLRAAIPESVFGRHRSLGLDDGLIGQALRERRVVTIRDRLLQAGAGLLSDESALIAGPLLTPGGEPCGVIVIERLPFLKFTPANISLFAIILDWASNALANASLHEEMRERLIEDDVTGAYRAAHMLRLMHEHMGRGHRYGVPITIVVAHIDGLAAPDPATDAETSRTIVAAMRRCLREVDIVGHHPDRDRLIFILPMTDRANAELACARMADHLDARDRPGDPDRVPLTVRFAVVPCAGPPITPEAVLAEAAKLLTTDPTASPAESTNGAPESVSMLRPPLLDDALSASGGDD